MKEVAKSWPEDWAEPAERTRFTLEWLPDWFALAAVVADERRNAAQAGARTHT